MCRHYLMCLEAIARESAPARQLMQLPGVGPTTATAMVAMIGRGQEFKCGRQLSAWLGLVPGQYSSGGKQRLGRITKAGDPYLRMLLIRVAIAATNARMCWAVLNRGESFKLPA
jgi:transposase